jgi:hypothetical protein
MNLLDTYWRFGGICLRYQLDCVLRKWKLYILPKEHSRRVGTIYISYFGGPMLKYEARDKLSLLRYVVALPHTSRQIILQNRPRQFPCMFFRVPHSLNRAIDNVL